MLRVNLIRQRQEAAAERRKWWTMCGAISAVLVVATAAYAAFRVLDITSLNHQIQVTQAKIKENQAAAAEAELIKERVTKFEPLSELARDANDTAYRWGVLMMDLAMAVPDGKGVWLDAYNTKFDSTNYIQTVTLEGQATEQYEISKFQTRLTDLRDTFDPTQVFLPKAETVADAEQDTQVVSFTIEATLREPIGVNYQ